MNREVLMGILVFLALIIAINIVSAYPSFNRFNNYKVDNEISPEKSISYVNTYSYQPNYFTTRYFDHYSSGKGYVAYYSLPQNYPKMHYYPSRFSKCR